MENQKYISILLLLWKMMDLFWQGFSTSVWIDSSMLKSFSQNDLKIPHMLVGWASPCWSYLSFSSCSISMHASKERTLPPGYRHLFHHYSLYLAICNFWLFRYPSSQNTPIDVMKWPQYSKNCPAWKINGKLP